MHDLDHPILAGAENTNKAQHAERVVQSNYIVVSLGLNYEMIDVCKNNYMLFWKDHKDATECMHCGRSRYLKVVNNDGASVTTKVVVKLLCYMLMTPRLKRLFL
jgi:hypothetical protein